MAEFNSVNIFKNKDTIMKYILIGVKSIVFGTGLVIALSMIFGCKFLKIISPSMTPTYNVGDVIFVDTNFNFDKLKVGDVVTYKSGATNVTHRIVDVFINSQGETRIVTQGDANGSIDPLCGSKLNPVGMGEDKFVGKVIFGIPGLGNLLETIAQPRNYIVLVVALILILFVTIM